MQIITCKEEYEEFYPYSIDNIVKYPEKYPCVCKWKWVDAGILGSYKEVYVAYFPEDKSSKESFMIGLSNPFIILK